MIESDSIISSAGDATITNDASATGEKTSGNLATGPRTATEGESTTADGSPASESRNGGLTKDPKIQLGLGLGLGIPSVIGAVATLWLCVVKSCSKKR